MNEHKKGYWIYSVFAIIFGFGLFAFLGYLIYDLVLKLSAQDFTNNTVVQALITLVVTVFIGGYFSKWLERVNNKKLEVFKIQRDISLSIVNLATVLLYHPENEQARELLVAESAKVKLYFDDDILSSLNKFIEGEDKRGLYAVLTDKLKKSLK